MTPDPLGLKASNSKKPESLNRYAYVENDPVNFLDPTGTNKASVECFLWVDWTLWDNGSITINFWMMFCTSGGDNSGGGVGDGSGSGSGGGQATPQVSNESDIRQGFREFLMANMSSECGEALADFMPMINSMAVGVNLIDVDKSPSMPASSYFHPDILAEYGISPSATIGEAFDIIKPGNGAYSVWGGNPVDGIYFRASKVGFSNGDPNSQSMYLLLHEMTHHATQETDAQLVTRFGITLKDKENSSQALSRFFNSGCKEK